MVMRAKMLALAAIAVAVQAVLTLPSMASSKAPLGYQLMCLEHPDDCKGGGTSVVAASDELVAQLRRVNSSVNRQIRPHSDGEIDTWSADVGSGDCEDYVLTKRRALLRHGLPASALRIAYVKTNSGEGHAILVVKTSAGDLVLDNLNPSVRPLARSGYRMVAMSGADPLQWT